MNWPRKHEIADFTERGAEHFASQHINTTECQKRGLGKRNHKQPMFLLHSCWWRFLILTLLLNSWLKLFTCEKAKKGPWEMASFDPRWDLPAAARTLHLPEHFTSEQSPTRVQLMNSCKGAGIYGMQGKVSASDTNTKMQVQEKLWVLTCTVTHAG